MSNMVFRTNKLLLYFCVFLSIILTGAFLYLLYTSDLKLAAAVLFLNLIVLPGVYLLIICRVEISDEGIQEIYKFPWRETCRAVKWSQINKISYGYFWMTGPTFWIWSSNGKTMAIGNQIAGYKNLMLEVLKNIPAGTHVDNRIPKSLA